MSLGLRAFHPLLADLERQGGVKPVVKVFVVTNGLLSRPEKERLEKHHGVRVQEVLHLLAWQVRRQLAEDKYDVHKVNAVMLKEMGLGSACPVLCRQVRAENGH